MVKFETIESRLTQYPCLSKDKTDPLTLICSVCNRKLNPDVTTIKRHIGGVEHQAKALQKLEKEDRVTRLRSKTLLENLPENEQFIRDFASVFAACGIASIHAPTVLKLFQKYADVPSVMDPCYLITDVMVNEEQRKVAKNLQSMISGLAKDEYFDIGCDETPGDRDHQLLQFALRSGVEPPRPIRIVQVEGKGEGPNPNRSPAMKTDLIEARTLIRCNQDSRTKS